MINASEKITRDSITSSELMEIRHEIVKALMKCGGGHFGGALSVADILWVLYTNILRIDRDAYHLRDRFILSKGHACIAQYVILSRLGYFESGELDNYARFRSILEGHPNMQKTPGIDFSSGSLGQGLSIALGMAMGLKEQDADAWVVLGDGECQEGQVWEAVLLASRLKIGNLKAVVDNNKYQEYGWYYEKDVVKVPVDNLEGKFEAFGWKTWSIDGHDLGQLETAFNELKQYRKGPGIVIANTVKGKGFGLIEADPIRFHCGELSPEEFTQLMYNKET